MKKLTWLILFFSVTAFAQEDAWVYFKDKPDTAYYMANPLEMLSQKALDRRSRQNIVLDDKDVPLHQAYVDAIASSIGIKVMARSRWLNALHIRGTVRDIRALKALAFVSRVAFADNSLNGQGRRTADTVNSQYSKQLEVAARYNYGASATQIQMLNGHLLHQQNFTGTGITVAVIDNGFPGVDSLPVFQHLRDNKLILGTYNYVDATRDVASGGTHGTLVLSTMAGYADGQLVGTAPDAFYYLFVTEDNAAENPVEESYWVEAAEAADSLGVDVINTSLGYFNFDNPAYSYSYEDIDGTTAFISRGANVAFSRGMFLVNAAGNTGAGTNPHITVPADAFNLLTVGAVDVAGQCAYFSSMGPSFDGRIKPDVMAMGLNAVIATTDGAITTGSGTSFASPITAGLVACLWQALPDKTNAELLDNIRRSADRYLSPDDLYGYGIPDFWDAYQNASLSHIADARQGFVIFPNPAEDVVHIAFPEEVTACNVVLYNGLGQVVLNQDISVTKGIIDISLLLKGIYNYTIAIKSGPAVRGRLIKL